MGPGIRVGMGRNTNGYYNGADQYIEDNTDSFYGKILINNGVVFSPIQSLSLSAILSLGIRYFPGSVNSNDVVKTTGAYSMNLSYRF